MNSLVAQRHQGAGVFRENIEKKNTCRHDENDYFCKSNVNIINLIVGSRNMIKD